MSDIAKQVVIVRGNDMKLIVLFRRAECTVNGKMTIEDFDLTKCTDINILLRSPFRVYTVVDWTLSSYYSNGIEVSLGQELPAGSYGMEVTGKLNGENWRYFAVPGELFTIVERTSDMCTHLGCVHELQSGMVNAVVMGGLVTLAQFAGVGDGTITSSKLADGAVTEEKIADGAITEEKLGYLSVGTDQIQKWAVTTEKLDDEAVTSDKIAAKAVGTSKLADKAVTEAKLADSAVTSAKIADGTIVSADLADNAITESKLASALQTKINGAAQVIEWDFSWQKNAVQWSGQEKKFIYLDDGDDDTELCAEVFMRTVLQCEKGGGIMHFTVYDDLTGPYDIYAVSYVNTAEKSSTGYDGEAIIHFFAPDGKPYYISCYGDIGNYQWTQGYTATTEIEDGSITTAKIKDSAVTSAKIADGTIVSADLADSAVTSAKIADGAVTSSKIADNAVTESKLASALQTKINGAAQVIEWDFSWQDNPVQWSGQEKKFIYLDDGDDDTTLCAEVFMRTVLQCEKGGGIMHFTVYDDLNGPYDIYAVSYVAYNLEKNSNGGYGGDAQIHFFAPDGKPYYIKCNGDIGNYQWTQGYTATTEIEDGSITTAKIKDSAVTSAKIADRAITNKKIALLAITGDEIQSAAIAEAKIADKAVTSDKIANLAITTDKIANKSITGAKLADELLYTTWYDGGNMFDKSAVTNGIVLDYSTGKVNTGSSYQDYYVSDLIQVVTGTTYVTWTNALFGSNNTDENLCLCVYDYHEEFLKAEYIARSGYYSLELPNSAYYIRVCVSKDYLENFALCFRTGKPTSEPTYTSFGTEVRTIPYEYTLENDKDTTYNVATQSADGLMSAEDKAKLDSIDTDSLTVSVEELTDSDINSICT